MPLICTLENHISKDKFSWLPRRSSQWEEKEAGYIFLLFFCLSCFISTSDVGSHSCLCNSSYLSPFSQIPSGHSLSLPKCGLDFPCWTWFLGSSNTISLHYPFSPLMDVAFNVMLLIARLSHWNSWLINVVTNWLY